jgi:hypothetical protein
MNKTTISNESLAGLLNAALVLVEIIKTKPLTDWERDRMNKAGSEIDKAFAQWLEDNPACKAIYKKQQQK